MTFHIDQRVVCAIVGGWPGYGRRVALPVQGRTYTVRAIVPTRLDGWDEDGIHLVEIINPRMRLLSARGTWHRTEVAFRMSRFRPVRTTNIDVFLQMLQPEPARFVLCEISARARPPWAARQRAQGGR